MNKMYLGDGVYAQTTPHGELKLTTKDGIRETNAIYLEPAVLQNLKEYIKRMEVL